jgi:hypothetical protein
MKIAPVLIALGLLAGTVNAATAYEGRVSIEKLDKEGRGGHWK